MLAIVIVIIVVKSYQAGQDVPIYAVWLSIFISSLYVLNSKYILLQDLILIRLTRLCGLFV